MLEIVAASATLSINNNQRDGHVIEIVLLSARPGFDSVLFS